MDGIRTVVQLELKLLLRSRGIWFAVPVMAIFGIWEASMAREVPYVAWSQFTVAALFVTLILTLSTGGQITNDRDRRVESVLLSTPIRTSSYVWGKYLAAVVIFLALALVMLGGAIGADHFDSWSSPPAMLGHSHYPSLGPWPYLGAWLWLVVVPIVFGTALALAAVTLTSGQRVLGSLVSVFLWLGPAIFGSSFSGGWVSLLDVAGMSYYGSAGTVPLPPALEQVYLTGSIPPPAVAAQMVQVVVAHLPPAMPVIFYWNRALFALLAVLLVLVTTVVVRVRRRGS